MLEGQRTHTVIRTRERLRNSVVRLNIVCYMSQFVWKVKGSVSETKLADNICNKVVDLVAEPGAFLYDVSVGSLGALAYSHSSKQEFGAL